MSLVLSAVMLHKIMTALIYRRRLTMSSICPLGVYVVFVSFIHPRRIRYDNFQLVSCGAVKRQCNTKDLVSRCCQRYFGKRFEQHETTGIEESVRRHIYLSAERGLLVIYQRVMHTLEKTLVGESITLDVDPLNIIIIVKQKVLNKRTFHLNYCL